MTDLTKMSVDELLNEADKMAHGQPSWSTYTVCQELARRLREQEQMTARCAELIGAASVEKLLAIKRAAEQIESRVTKNNYFEQVTLHDIRTICEAVRVCREKP